MPARAEVNPVCPRCGESDGFYGLSTETYYQTLSFYLYGGEVEYEIYDQEYQDTIEQRFYCSACDAEVSIHELSVPNQNEINLRAGRVLP